MNYQTEEFESKNFDYLGIIAGIIDEIGIVEKINEIRKKIFTDKYILISHELNVLNLILSQEG